MRLNIIKNVFRLRRKNKLLGCAETKKAPHINNEGFERCVLCGKQTSVLISTPIDFRADYVIGCGQLCSACKQKLYQAEKENIITQNILYLLIKESKTDI